MQLLFGTAITLAVGYGVAGIYTESLYLAYFSGGCTVAALWALDKATKGYE